MTYRSKPTARPNWPIQYASMSELANSVLLEQAAYLLQSLTQLVGDRPYG